jgi:hypothetical protein
MVLRALPKANLINTWLQPGAPTSEQNSRFNGLPGVLVGARFCQFRPVTLTTLLVARFAIGYSAHVKCSRAIAIVSIVLLASRGFCSDINWAGEYANENLLDGKAAFQLSIEQSGNAIEVSFNAAYADGHGAAPDGGGSAKITGKSTLEFKWEDSFNNAGTGTISLAGKNIIVSMKATRVEEPRCLAFYGDHMRLKRVKK